MKSLTKFYLITLCLAMTLGDCNKPDNTVLITYQHLANFQSWELNGKAGADPKGMWHVYMLRGIINKGKDAQPFTFDLQKLATNNGETVNSSSSAMLNAAPETMPLNFTATVKPQEAFSIPFGTGALFFIKQENDTEQTPVTNLSYKSTGQESVLLVMLDQKAPVMFGHLDQDFLNKIHAKQNEYENNYEPGGNKK